jgi:hypothetical protein
LAQHSPDLFEISLPHQGRFPEASFALARFAGKEVSVKGFPSLYLVSSAHPETLGSGSIAFLFWHRISLAIWG